MGKILIGAGGTAGHLIPAQELARRLGKLQRAPQILFAGGKLSQNRFFEKELPHVDLPAATLSVKRPFKAPRVAWGILKAWRLLGTYRPDLVVGFGSYHTFPLLMAARLRGLPFVLHEGNAFPGRVTRLFAKHAVLTGLQFPGAAEHLKGRCVPVELHRPFEPLDEEAICHTFTVLVFGGSQGAASLNGVVSEALCKLNAPLRVIHLTGDERSVEAVKRRYEEREIRAFVSPFEHRMDLAWQAADLVICRAGAATCAEQVRFGTPAIMVPYPHATDRHQHHNASELERKGGVIKLEERRLREQLLPLLEDLVGGGVRQCQRIQEEPHDFAQVIAEVAGWA
ncbi:MAG: glycosyltransferase [Parachlamydiales bacterium]